MNGNSAQKIADFVGEPNDQVVTPESLAWNLVMNGEIGDFEGVMQRFVTGGHNGNQNASTLLEANYLQLSDEFQILIIIYIEMVYHILKMNYIGEFLDENGQVKDGVDLEEALSRFEPDFTLYDLTQMTDIFRNKFQKIRYFLSILDITELCDRYDDANFGPYVEYYCKVLLLDDLRSSTRRYFSAANHIPDGKRYTFLLRNDLEHKQKTLDDFYAVVYLPPFNGSNKARKIKISFSRYTVIGD